MKKKTPVTVRISPEARQLLVSLSDKQQISQGAVIELAIRELAERHGITVVVPKKSN